MSDRYPDVCVENHGSIFLIHPYTDTAARWIGENVNTDEAQFLGRALAVEPRYVEDLVAGMQAAGMRVI